MSEIVCPIDNKDDKIQKVSSIVASHSSNESITELGSMLYPPQEPVRKGFGCISWVLFIHVSLIVSAIAGLIVGLIPGLIFGEAVRILVSVVVAIGALIYQYMWVIRKHRQNKVIYTRQKEVWHKVVERWNRLYYCFRDDIIFDPKTEKYFPPWEMEDFLFWNLDWKEDHELEKVEGFLNMFMLAIFGIFAFIAADSEEHRVRRAVNDELNRRGY